jgi:uncharacterized protein YndB with AHSA1/START domain
MKWLVGILAGLVALVVLCIAGLWLAGLRPGHGHIAEEIVIERPAPEVFRWLTDDDRVKRWIGGLTEIRQISAAADGSEIGTKFRLAEYYNGQRVDMEMDITKFEKDRALSIFVSSIGDPNNGFTETGDYTLTEQNGKTQLRFEVQTKYSGFVLRLFEPMITPKAKEKLDEDFRRLKELTEAEPKTT